MYIYIYIYIYAHTHDHSLRIDSVSESVLLAGDTGVNFRQKFRRFLFSVKFSFHAILLVIS